ncbi:pre-mRNA-splicing regulator WTAP-like isoform X2 [Littorina saxatilis]
MDDHVSYLQAKQRGSLDKDDGDDKEGDDKKQQNQDASRRENTLVLRLTNKEQELQDCMNQIAEMKSSQSQNSAQLRSLLLDPAVNLVFQRMAKEMDDCKEKLKQSQNELSAWKFTADSQMGKRLMAKCRMLLQENEELGKVISSGRTSKLEAEIALQKTMVTEMKTNQDEMNEFVSELEEDVEGMQSMIYVLQQQLKETKENLAAQEAENARLRTLQSTSTPVVKQEPSGSSSNNNATTSDSSGGVKSAGTCAGDNCAPGTVCNNSKGGETSCGTEGSPGTRNVADSKARTTDATSPQTSSATITPKTETSQQTPPSKRISGGADDIDGAPQMQQQPNGRTSAEGVEKSRLNCLPLASETSEQSVAAATKMQCDNQTTDSPTKGGRELRTDDKDIKMVTSDSKSVRNGGLEGVTQSTDELEK